MIILVIWRKKAKVYSRFKRIILNSEVLPQFPKETVNKTRLFCTLFTLFSLHTISSGLLGCGMAINLKNKC